MSAVALRVIFIALDNTNITVGVSSQKKRKNEKNIVTYLEGDYGFTGYYLCFSAPRLPVGFSV